MASHAYDDTAQNIDTPIAGGPAGTALFFLGGNDVVKKGYGESFAGFASGGDGHDNLLSGLGDDTLSGDNGSDALNGNAGDDELDGGSGNDVLFGDNEDPVTGTGHYGQGFGNDLLRGGSGSDIVNGGGGDDTLEGGTGDDQLLGDANPFGESADAGNDKLYGGDGEDSLTGGAGTDRMWGGDDADTFIFTDIADSSKKGKQADVIRDFSRKEDDQIDLSAIDAKTGGADNAFKYIGDDDFNDKKGELRFDNGKLQGDVDGDGKKDFTIKVDVETLSGNDFVL